MFPLSVYCPVATCLRISCSFLWISFALLFPELIPVSYWSYRCTAFRETHRNSMFLIFFLGFLLQFCFLEVCRLNHLRLCWFLNSSLICIWFSAPHLFRMFVCPSSNCLYYTLEKVHVPCYNMAIMKKSVSLFPCPHLQKNGRRCVNVYQLWQVI